MSQVSCSRVLRLFGALCLAAGATFAQSDLGSIQGVVKGPSVTIEVSGIQSLESDKNRLDSSSSLGTDTANQFVKGKL